MPEQPGLSSSYSAYQQAGLQNRHEAQRQELQEVQDELIEMNEAMQVSELPSPYSALWIEVRCLRVMHTCI